MGHEPLFVGRRPELDRWKQVLAEPLGQAVLVVGHPGMGKTLLVNKMGRLAREHPEFTCSSVRYEVTPSDSATSRMEAMIEDAFRAANTSKPFLSKGTTEQWQALFKTLGIIPLVGGQLQAGAELIRSLCRNPRRDTRDQFIERLELISNRMEGNGRAVFIIDPEKYMQADSDQDWAIVVRRLPPKIKILFAQRPDDELVRGGQFRGLTAQGRAVRIPAEELDVLDEQALDELIRIRARQMKRGELELREAVARYERHPYAIAASLDLIAAGTPIEDLPTDPTPEAIAYTQWSKVGQGGAAGQLGDKAIALFQAYAVLEVPVPDDIVEIVAAVTPTERTALTLDGYLSSLLRMVGNRRCIYHAMLADHIRGDMQDRDAERYHRRVIEELRRRLKHAQERQTAPDDFAARRLAVHTRKVESPAAFVLTYLDECVRPLLTLGLFDTALVLSQAALAEAERNSVEAARSYSSLGVIYCARGDLDHAEQMHRKGLEIEEQLGRLKGMAVQWGNLGLICQTRGDLEQAEQMHRKGLEIAEQLGWLEGMADAYNYLGMNDRMRGDLDQAEQMLRKALEIKEKLGQLRGMAGEYYELGVVYRMRGDLEQAEQMLRKSLEMNEQLGRLKGMAGNYNELGLIYETRGDLDRAEEMLRKSLEIYEKLGHPVGVAVLWGNLGLIHHVRGDLDRAEQMCRKSLQIDEKLGRLEGMAAQYGELGRIYTTRGDLDRAEQMLRKSLEMHEKLGDLDGIAIQWGNLGLIYWERGDLDRAKQMHCKALDIDQEIGKLEGMAACYCNLAVVCERRGDLDEARHLRTMARDLYGKIGMPHMVTRVQGWLDELGDRG